MIPPFLLSNLPRIRFGAGSFAEVGETASQFGRGFLILTSGHFGKAGHYWGILQEDFSKRGLRFVHSTVTGEPSPDLVDKLAAEFRDQGVDAVIAIGGGSVIDAGKAVSAMLPKEESVLKFLEGVGNQVHDGSKVPFIAVPTTAGTGSEATKNAVLGRVGPEGFKKSLRHDRFVPDVAIIDPELMLTCPFAVSAACGMDALTQLLESYVSTNASLFTDALAWSGLEALSGSLLRVCLTDPWDVGARAGMAYAALMSGITLANAGLGIVHGLAGPLGGHIAMPHGAICGTLVAEATSLNLKKLEETPDDGNPFLRKYAQVGYLLAGRAGSDINRGCDLLVQKLEEWTETLAMPRLGTFGMLPSDISLIAEQTGSRNNPVNLSKQEIEGILASRI